MKYKCLTSFLLISPLLAYGLGSPVAFNGIYVGAGGGKMKTTLKSERKQVNTNPIEFFFDKEEKTHLHTSFFSLDAGYSHAFENRFYTAIELTYKSYDSNNQHIPNYSFDVLLKPGFVFASNTAIFGLVGVGMNKVDFPILNYQCTRAEGCGPSTFVYDNRVNQFFAFTTVGAGIKQALTNRFSISLEGQYIVQRDFAYSGVTYSPNALIWNMHNYKIQHTSAQGLLKLDYLFVNV
ncbi:TPA: hypothetical protein JBD48_16670 [Legionella pneumophila subsp. pneumophila]|nr:hypothetical protein [Legionella pneumophila subsp. pneumophila]